MNVVGVSVHGVCDLALCDLAISLLYMVFVTLHHIRCQPLSNCVLCGGGCGSTSWPSSVPAGSMGSSLLGQNARADWWDYTCGECGLGDSSSCLAGSYVYCSMCRPYQDVNAAAAY